MAGVRAGGDRQELHELVRQHSQAAAAEVKTQGKPNDLIQRLQADPAFAKINLDQVLDAKAFIGRAPQQVDRFLQEVVIPIRKRYASQLNAAAELTV